MKYSPSHKIVICGDFNGTLLEPRPYNRHDRLLQTFMKDLNLSHSTFHLNTSFQLSGAAFTQIDYITSSVKQSDTR